MVYTGSRTIGYFRFWPKADDIHKYAVIIWGKNATDKFGRNRNGADAQLVPHKAPTMMVFALAAGHLCIIAILLRTGWAENDRHN